MACLFEYPDDVGRFKVAVEDDDRVAYAYLLRDGRVVGDVWLYNRGLPPAAPEWHDRSKAPFANPRGFARAATVNPIRSVDDVRVEWIVERGELERAKVYLRGKLLALLAPGARPGWCRNAVKDGPLAKRLSVEGDNS
jgi:hypothetical protein